MRHTAVLIPGDGIGLEVSVAVREILAAAGAPIDWVEHLAGEVALQHGKKEFLPAETLNAITEHKIALKGPCTTPIGRRLRFGQRRAAQEAEPVRRGAAAAQHAGREDALRQRRPGDHPREHRGPVQRPRERDHAGRRGLDEGRDARGLPPHRRLVVPLRHAAQAQARQRAAQGQHHEDDRRHVPGRSAQGARQLSRRSSTTSISSTPR